MTENKGQNTPRDVFLYLLSIITLIVIAVAFGILVFQLINIYIPDVVSDPYFSSSSYLSSIRNSLATLIIVFPVFLWVMSFLRKDLSKFPAKRDLKIRRWLLYLTLFAAALVIIGDAVALVINFLEGELSQRFLLKVLAILFIAGSVFIHYFSELREKERQFSWIKTFDWLVVLVVIVGVAGGFYSAGSPKSQRLIRLDERRVSDLQSIQWQLINYWQRKEILPASLNELNDPISNFAVPQDPETGKIYEYRTLGDLTFQLCAEFSSEGLTGSNVPRAVPSSATLKGIDMYSAWQHGLGRVCFDRTIDPQLYPPLKNQPKPL